jgi:ubiquinone/menaquinone biosynthesis C-methylase UbiE
VAPVVVNDRQADTLVSLALLRLSRLPLFPLIVAREKLARRPRPRQVGGEPAVMDEPQGVKEYDEFGTAGEVGVHQFAALGISRLLPEGGTLLDLGCGSGRLLARLAHGRPDARVIGLDLSEPMLETGGRTLEREGLSGRVELRRGDITSFDADLQEPVDVVSCNFALHHLPTVEHATRCLEAIARTRSRTGCAVWIFDFARLRHPGSWPALTSMLNWPGPVVHSDAIESERAAFSAEELTALLERAGLDDLEHVRSRPLGEQQLHWVAARDRPVPVTGLWRGRQPEGELRLLARLTTSAFPRSLTAS